MMPLWWYPVLFAASLVAGFVDSIAGGGGLITVPVLLSAGLSPQAALGTNKLQASFGSGSAAGHYARAGLMGWKEVRLGVGITFAASMLGAFTVQQISPAFLEQLIPALLIALALYTLFQPQLGLEDRQARLSPHLFAGVFGVLIGFYDGFFGPGTGSFWAMACVLFRGVNLTRATAYTKAMNFASNVGSLLIFLLGGHVHFGIGLLMGMGQWTGARLGSRLGHSERRALYPTDLRRRGFGDHTEALDQPIGRECSSQPAQQFLHLFQGSTWPCCRASSRARSRAGLAAALLPSCKSHRAIRICTAIQSGFLARATSKCSLADA